MLVAALLLGQCVSPLPPPPPSGITYVPEFLAVWRLLSDRQGIVLGTPSSADAPTGALVHFQTFLEADNLVLNSAEMHRDGCIYVSYTPRFSPLWYDSTQANESPEPAFGAPYFKDSRIPAGSREQHPDGVPFSTLKAQNVSPVNWKTSAEAFRDGRGPAPRWFVICVPPNVSPDAWPPEVTAQIPRATLGLLFLDAGAYCEWGTSHIIGPGEWANVLPLDTPGTDNGQKKYFPDQPLDYVDPSGGTNFYPTWRQFMQFAQDDPNRLNNILQYRGRPTENDYENRSIPWMTSVLEGIVTNSFLSGGDYRGDHANPPGRPVFQDGFWETDYWLGTRRPLQVSASHGPLSTVSDPDPIPIVVGGPDPFTVINSLDNDWIVFVKPDPEYRFMLASSFSHRGDGNFDGEHEGNFENEIEQWLIPGGLRPEAGDRVYMAGRWVVDCGHNDWHAEIHPFELIVGSHTQTGRADAIGNVEMVAPTVVTGDWTGQTLEFDVWAPPRPNAMALLHCAYDPLDPSAQFPNGGGVIVNAFVNATPAPRDNANHVHVRVTSRTPVGPLSTGSRNNVDPDTSRRVALTFHVWWSSNPSPSPNVCGPAGS